MRSRVFVVSLAASLGASLVAVLGAPRGARAQGDASPVSGDALELTLERSLALALARSFGLRTARLGVQEAEAQVAQARAGFLPRVDFGSNYTRTFVTPNPFAGTEAAAFFQAFDAIDWLAFNEAARTDGDPANPPITLEEFRRRQVAGREAAGLGAPVADASRNPFLVPNFFDVGFTLTQILYDGGIVAASRGARAVKSAAEAEAMREVQRVVQAVTEAFYAALLAKAAVEVSAAGVERTEATRAEAERRVARGVAPLLTQMNEEVELANRAAELVDAENQSASAIDALLLTLGIPPALRVSLVGELRPPEAQAAPPRIDEAVDAALARRPDLRAARERVAIEEARVTNARADYLPRVRAVGDARYIGRVPDDRTAEIIDPADPFAFRLETRGFFSGAYWGPSLTLGVVLDWNLFDGLGTGARVAQAEVGVSRARIEEEALAAQIRAEVAQAIRGLDAAQRRIRVQERTVKTAETAYEHARLRVEEGVAAALELRIASEQLDRSRLGLYRAIHDFRVAEVALAVAGGLPEELAKRYATEAPGDE